MASVEAKNFSSDADEVMTPNNARVETVNVMGQRVMRLTVQPGWQWSKDIKPLVGTDSCQAKHVGVIIEGTIKCVHDDGSEITYSAGDAYAIAPGHDALWPGRHLLPEPPCPRLGHYRPDSRRPR